MPTNQIKRYNSHLDLSHLSEQQRIESLKHIFNRDIAENPRFLFRNRIIRPLKSEGAIDMETLFSHLTKKTEDINNSKSRSIFDIERSKRLHWIWYHIQERKTNSFEVFSYKERKGGRNSIKTYLYDIEENYVIVLEPQRSGQDYYLLTAYYINEEWSKKNLIKKMENKLDELY